MESYRVNPEDAININSAVRRAGIELELVGALIRNRRRGMKWADHAGLHVSDFDEPDCKCIFAALDVMRERPLADVLHGARFLLIHESLWLDDEPAHSTRMIWSYDKLTKLACGDPCPGLIGIMLMELISFWPSAKVSAAA